MTTNVKLAIATLALLVCSVWVYSDSVSRGERFSRGQKLLANLNPDEVATIEIVQGSEQLTLERSAEGFTIEQNHGYPARNDAINRFLRDLLDIGLAKEVGTGTALNEELEIEPTTDTTVEIALLNDADQEMVRLRLGKAIEDRSGRYVRRLDREGDPIYLTEGTVALSTTLDSFIRNEIVNVSQSEVVRVEGDGFLLEAPEPDASIVLSAIPGGKKEKSVETNKLKSILSRLRFETALLADDDEVRQLKFERVLQIDLADESGYQLAFASTDEKSYIQIRGHHNVAQVQIELDTPKDELEEKVDTLSRIDEIEDFNAFHASWVYEVSSFTADKLKLVKSDLLEDAS